MMQLLKSMKFMSSIDRYFLTKSTLYCYRDQADFADNNSFNIIETLFSHVNFELLRAQPLEFNSSLRFVESNWILDSNWWAFRSSHQRTDE
jgi:hypothetical protein